MAFCLQGSSRVILYDSFGDAAWFQSDEPKHGDHSICSKPVIPVVPKNLSNSVREQLLRGYDPLYLIPTSPSRQQAVVYPLWDPRTNSFAVPRDSINHFCARSFSGTAATDPEWAIDWLLGPMFRNNREAADRVEIVKYLMDLTVSIYGRYPKLGIMYASRRREAPSSEPSAMLVARKYPKGWTPEWNERIWTSCLMHFTPRPTAYTSRHKRYTEWRSALKKRVAAFDAIMYVSIMATAPEREGEGHCSALMRAMCRAADADGLPTYLEAGSDRNVAVYRRFDFEVVGQHTLSIEGDEPGNAPMTTFYCMLRRPAAPPCATGPRAA